MQTVIEKQPFGKTGHQSTRAIFGSVCLKRASQDEADRVLELLLNHGINHIDTAPSYGDAELRVGSWMKHQRDSFFLATKTDKGTYQEAREQFHESLDRLQVDHVDLLQLHNLTDVVYREITMGPGGALEYLIEAREQGLARFIGITGHNLHAPRMHLQTLGKVLFDSVLLPCNYLLLQNPQYSADFDNLLSFCQERDIAVQTIKSIARSYWGNKERSHVTWYEPLTDAEAIRKTVHWVLGRSSIFLITVGDMQELPKVLEAVAGFQSPPTITEMQAVVKEEGMELLFR